MGFAELSYTGTFNRTERAVRLFIHLLYVVRIVCLNVGECFAWLGWVLDNMTIKGLGYGLILTLTISCSFENLKCRVLIDTLLWAGSSKTFIPLFCNLPGCALYFIGNQASSAFRFLYIPCRQIQIPSHSVPFCHCNINRHEPATACSKHRLNNKTSVRSDAAQHSNQHENKDIS